jgi:ABC-type transport system involved in multi-copper enzyme maturation permease subunit
MRFICFVALMASSAVLYTWIAWFTLAHHESSTTVTRYRMANALAMGPLITPFALLMMAFGTNGVGEELAQRTADSLFTRPRSRRHFIWVEWAAGALAVFGVVCAYTFVTFFMISYLTGTIFTWKVLATAFPVLLICLACYSLGHLMATLLRSGRKGYAVGLGMIIFYGVLGNLLRIRWHIRLPDTQDLMLPFWHLVEGAHIPWVVFHFPVVAVTGWSLFVLVCPLVAQLYIERSDT